MSNSDRSEVLTTDADSNDQGDLFLTEEISFSAAHLYRVSSWTDEKNQTEFGRCYSDYGHGHDYVFRVTFSIKTTEKWFGTTREKLALEALSALRKKYDHTHLNFPNTNGSNEAFKSRVPTTEVILQVLSVELDELLKTTELDGRVVGAELIENSEMRSSWGKTWDSALHDFSRNHPSEEGFRELELDLLLQPNVPVRLTALTCLNRVRTTETLQTEIQALFSMTSQALTAFRHLIATERFALFQSYLSRSNRVWGQNVSA